MRTGSGLFWRRSFRMRALTARSPHDRPGKGAEIMKFRAFSIASALVLAALVGGPARADTPPVAAPPTSAAPASGKVGKDHGGTAGRDLKKDRADIHAGKPAPPAG